MRKCVSSTILVMLAMLLFVQGVAAAVNVPFRIPQLGETIIATADDLAKIGKEYPLNGKYVLMADIDLSDYAFGEGWTPIGSEEKPFTGSFDGNGFQITNLSICRPDAEYQGLFGCIRAGAKLSNITLSNVNVKGQAMVGGLVGEARNSFITSCSSSGVVTAVTGGAGGLVGYNGCSVIVKSYTTGKVGLGARIGGLVGYNSGTIENCYSVSDVFGTFFVGGLVGINQGNIVHSYSAGQAKPFFAPENFTVGHLVGLDNWVVVDSYDLATESGDFSNWDFFSVWCMEEEVPHLQNNP